MPQDLSLELRRAVVAHLRADGNVTALVPANRIYGEFSPDHANQDWPFIRMGYQVADSFEATGGWDGSEHDFTVHAFAHGPGTDAISLIAKRVQASLEGFAPMNIGGWSDWRGTTVLPDEVATDLHAVLRFEMVAVAN